MSKAESREKVLEPAGQENEGQPPIDAQPLTHNEPLPETAAADDAVISRALAWSLVVIGAVGLAVGGAVWWFNRRPPDVVIISPPIVQRIRTQAKVQLPRIRFADVTAESGLDFMHHNGANGEKLLPETMGGGCAFFDYDRDNDPDLLLINSCDWPWTKREAGQALPTMKLYRNDGRGQFTDVTVGSGLDITFYGQGVAVGDYDNDGWVDVFITAVAPQIEAAGANRLFRNEQGFFVDVTSAMGVAGNPGNWSTGAGFLDYDNDGDLDLFVGNYIHWSREIDLAKEFTLDGKRRAYGRPNEFEGAYPYLYRNDGTTFVEVAEAAGLHITGPLERPLAKTLAVVPFDLDQDGWIDLIVANDTVQNLVFRNLRDGRFQEQGVASGIAFDNTGAARGAMGGDAAYFRNDGKTVCVAIGNFSNEMTAFYVSQGNPFSFFDAALASGIGPLTRLQLTFGVVFLDFDLDGRLDLFEANGHLEEEINTIQETQHYAQPPVLFWNAGAEAGNEFLRMTPDVSGNDLSVPMVGRGAAVADVDGDGDQDILITASGGRPRLLRNEAYRKGEFLRLKLVGRQSNRDAIGAWVDVYIGNQVLRRQVMPTRSYLSQSELPLTIAFDAPRPDRVVVRWPGGGTQDISGVELNNLVVVEQAP